MEFRSARASEREEVLDLLALWHNDRGFFERYNRIDPTFRDEFCLVALDNGRIVSTVQIFDRKINLDVETVPMGGIGSVFTHDDYRHKRVASGLMKLAVSTMERAGLEVSLLFAERLTFYNQFGWTEITRNFTALMNAADLVAPHFVIDVFDRDRDFAEVVRLHRSYSGRFDVTAVRDQADWRANLEYAGSMPVTGCAEYFILARRGDQIAGYARVTRFYGIVMVMEFGYSPGNASAVVAMLKHFGEMASSGNSTAQLRGDHGGASLLRSGQKGSGDGILVTHTAHDPELEKALVDAGGSIAHHPDNFYMWRINLPERLGRRFNMDPESASKYVLTKFADPRSLYWTADRF